MSRRVWVILFVLLLGLCLGVEPARAQGVMTDVVMVEIDGVMRTVTISFTMTGVVGVKVAPVPPATSPLVTSATANRNANLRGGPGTTFGVVGSVLEGDALEIIGKNAAGDWYELAGGAWIAAFLVDDAPALVPTVVVAPTATGVPVAASAPALVPTATPAPAVNNSGGGENAFTCAGGCATVPPGSSCAIKGNVNSKGDRIYHSPGQRDYERTDIKPEEGDRWFCTGAEAEAAGFRAAQR